MTDRNQILIGTNDEKYGEIAKASIQLHLKTSDQYEIILSKEKEIPEIVEREKEKIAALLLEHGHNLSDIKKNEELATKAINHGIPHVAILQCCKDTISDMIKAGVIVFPREKTIQFGKTLIEKLHG